MTKPGRDLKTRDIRYYHKPLAEGEMFPYELQVYRNGDLLEKFWDSVGGVKRQIFSRYFGTTLTSFYHLTNNLFPHLNKYHRSLHSHPQWKGQVHTKPQVEHDEQKNVETSLLIRSVKKKHTQQQQLQNTHKTIMN